MNRTFNNMPKYCRDGTWFRDCASMSIKTPNFTWVFRTLKEPLGFMVRGRCLVIRDVLEIETFFHEEGWSAVAIFERDAGDGLGLFKECA